MLRQSRRIQDEETVPGIQHPGSTGVIYCSDRAQANGFNYASSHEWSNLGQGAPEVGSIPEAPTRPTKVEYDYDALEYAPTTGVKSVCGLMLCRSLILNESTELREAVANLYNITYRKGKTSKYTYENICIVPGGRAGLSRIAAVVGDVYCVRIVSSITSMSHVLMQLHLVLPSSRLYGI